MNPMFATCVSALKTLNASTNINFTAGKKLMKKYKKHAFHLEHVNLFNTQMLVLKNNIIVKREQNTFYNNVKDNLKENEVLVLTIARTIATKINKKSKVPTLGIIYFQYSRLVGDDEKIVSKNILVKNCILQKKTG